MFQKFTTKSQPALPRVATEYPAPLLQPEPADIVVSRREDYLDRILAPLTHLLPFARRQELRLEMRQHLDAMISAYQELGETAEKACEKAFLQFGKPEEVAESIKKSAVYPTRWQRLRAWCAQPRMSVAGALPVLLLATTLYFGLARPVPQTQTAASDTRIQVASVTGKTIINGIPFNHRNAVMIDKIPCTSCHAGNRQSSVIEATARTRAAREQAVQARWQAIRAIQRNNR